MRALYDLSRYLTSFNFYEWLVQAEADGATSVLFDVRRIRQDKWPAHIAHERFLSICKPGPALIGLPYEIGTIDPVGARDFGAPGGARLVKFCKSGRTFKRLRTVKPAGSERYTVTLRRTQRAPGRNSNEAVWRDFARGIGARVIPDYEDEPIHMHDRMALYAGAEMNFFCSNGPGILCSLSEYPCMMFNTHHARESLIGDGMKEGEQYPWMLANQRAIWEEATGASLMRHFLYWRETGGFL
jgi:hypothetical protein